MKFVRASNRFGLQGAVAVFHVRLFFFFFVYSVVLLTSIFFVITILFFTCFLNFYEACNKLNFIEFDNRNKSIFDEFIDSMIVVYNLRHCQDQHESFVV